MRTILTTLRAIGREVVVLGEQVAIMPFGGRVIALSPDSEANVLWTNPALDSPDSARSFLESDDWLNSGGDRTWISPEIDTNVGDAARFAETYQVPKVMDPAAYQVTSSMRDSVTVETDVELRFNRSGRVVPLHLVKCVTVVKPPVDVPESVSAAGYTLDVTLTAELPLPPEVRPGIWNLLQVPGSGTITIPVRGAAQTAAFIGSPVFRIEGATIECDVDNKASFKFGIHADSSLGAMHYLRGDGEQAVLVSRMFEVKEAGTYADVPCNDLEAHGYMQQIYVDDGNFGGFGELEHHSPAIGEQNGEDAVRDRSQVWAFSGPAEAISTLRDNLLTRK